MADNVVTFPVVARPVIGRPKPRPPKEEHPAAPLIQVEHALDAGWKIMSEIADAQMKRLSMAGRDEGQVREEMRLWLAQTIMNRDVGRAG